VGEARFETIAVASAGGATGAELADVAGSLGVVEVVVGGAAAIVPVEAAGGATLGAGDEPPQPTESEKGEAIATEAATRKRNEEWVMKVNRDTSRDRLCQASGAESPSRTSATHPNHPEG